jgi:hypothetical protein
VTVYDSDRIPVLESEGIQALGEQGAIWALKVRELDDYHGRKWWTNDAATIHVFAPVTNVPDFCSTGLPVGKNLAPHHDDGDDQGAKKEDRRRDSVHDSDDALKSIPAGHAAGQRGENAENLTRRRYH